MTIFVENVEKSMFFGEFDGIKQAFGSCAFTGTILQ